MIEYHGPTLAATVRTSAELLGRFLAGFDDANRCAQAPGLANHAAWTLGHCALTRYRGAALIDAGTLPEDRFVKADGRGGGPLVFDTESVCFGSKPAADPALYPGWSRCRETFDAAVERLALAADGADAHRLSEPVPWGAATTPAGALVGRLAFHNGTHAGQLIDLRRAIGIPPLWG